MENFTIKRRIIRKEDIPLYEILLILASHKSWHPHIGDPLSLCLRVCILNDLFFYKSLSYDGVITVGATDDIILNESLCKINDKQYTVDEAIRILNGEIGSGIKNLRERVLNKLENKCFVKYNKTFFGFRVKAKKDVLDQYTRDVLGYLLGSCEDTRYDVLVCCLDYIGVINKILQTEKECDLVKRRLTEIIKKMRRRGDFPAKTIQNLYQ